MSVLSVSKLRDSNFLRPTTDLFMCTVPSFRVSAPRIFPGLMPTLTLPIPPRCRNMGTLSRLCRYDADSLLQLLTGSLRILRMLLTTTALQSISTGGGLSELSCGDIDLSVPTIWLLIVDSLKANAFYQCNNIMCKLQIFIQWVSNVSIASTWMIKFLDTGWSVVRVLVVADFVTRVATKMLYCSTES